MTTATAEDTKAQLVAAAEVLFAERGIEAVSLREINRAANQANASALQYHFGDRAGLVRAVLRKHHPDVEARRSALLDAYDGAGDDDLRALAAALVQPLAAKLDDPDGGRAYLRVLAELAQRPDPVTETGPPGDRRDSVNRWRRTVEPLLDPDATKILHARFTAIRFAYGELARRAMAAPRRDDRLFTSHLIDLVVALLSASPSPATARLIEKRRRR